MGVWDVDGDERNVRGGDLVADDGGDLVLDLKLDDEIDSGADELFGILDSGGGVVLVVEQIRSTPTGGGGFDEAAGHFVGEGHVGALAGEAEAELLGTGDVAIGSVRAPGRCSRDAQRF